MRRALVLLAGFALACGAGPSAGVGGLLSSGLSGATWCNGGYDAPTDLRSHACNQPAVERAHGDWHFHTFVTDGTRCYACWDEEDSTCESGFLASHPGWAPTLPLFCDLHDGSGTVQEHVIDGKDVVSGPPPALTARLDPLPKGPVGVGDTLGVAGSLRDPTGRVRPVAGGTFRVDAGGVITDVRGVVGADGMVRGTIQVPAAQDTTVTFVADPPTLGAGERLVAGTPVALRVDLCLLRARVVAPAAAAGLLSGQATGLRATLLDRAGRPAPAPPGATVGFVVRVDGEPDATVPADATLSATWTPPASPTGRTVHVRAEGGAGAARICPEAEVAATVSELGLGADNSELPTECWTGLACGGTAKLVRPPAGFARQRVDALLADPATEVELLDEDTTVARHPPSGDDRYAFAATYTTPRSGRWHLRVHGPGGVIVDLPEHVVPVKQALKVVLPEALDFGTVRAGTGWTMSCQALDFGASTGAFDHGFELALIGGNGCLGRPVLLVPNGVTSAPVPLDPAVVVQALDSGREHAALTICLETPACAGETAPPGVALRVTPTTALFADQARHVRLAWTIEGRPWYACHGWWIGPLAGLALAGVVAAGFVRPARFSAAASIRVAGTEKGLKRASSILLVDCPGSAARFYRDARLGVHADGTVDGRTRGALLRIRAVKGGGAVLVGTGIVEVQDRRTLAWTRVDDLARGHLPSGNAVYRAGGLYFRVDGG